jgi:hypothetical protein
MSINNFFEQIKGMEKKDRRTLLDKLTAALTPEQQDQVRQIVQDKKQLEKVKNSLTGDDFNTLVEGLSGKEDAKDFLQSPQVQSRIDQLLK